MILQEGQQSCLVMLAGIQASQTVPLVRINLQLIRFADLHEGVNQLACVIEMYILVYETMNDQQSIFFVGKFVNIC